MSILFFVSACALIGAVQTQQSCFKQTASYGTISDTTFTSDLSYLRSQNFRETMQVSQLYVCGAFSGTYMKFEGI